MYNNKIAVSLKHAKKPLPELNNKFLLPKNTQFSIYIKNMNDKTAYIDVYIDEIKINKIKIKLNKKESIEINKFEETNHSFTFIEKTIDLQLQRTNKIEDGIIRIEVDFEDDTINKLKDLLKKSDKDFPLTQPYYPEHSPTIVDGPLPYPLQQDIYCMEDQLLNREKIKNIKDSCLMNIEYNENNIIFKEKHSFEDISNSNIPSFSSSCLNKNFKDENNKNGIIVKGKITNKENDILDRDENIIKNNFKDGNYNIYESFTIIIELEVNNDLNLKDFNIKKKCPNCKKKYKKKYLYCPFDGTFLIKD